jgi:hypothetical protein
MERFIGYRTADELERDMRLVLKRIEAGKAAGIQ